MNAKARKIEEELGWEIAYARDRRERKSPDGRVVHQEIPSDLVEAVAIVIEKVVSGKIG